MLVQRRERKMEDPQKELIEDWDAKPRNLHAFRTDRYERIMTDWLKEAGLAESQKQNRNAQPTSNPKV